MTSRSDIIDGSQAIGRKYGLIYTRKCGWVDLGHANPDGPDGAKNLWDKILNEKDEGSGKSEFFRITYKQMMGNKYIKMGMQKKYDIKKGIQVNDKKSVALSIFLDVSNAFESMQSGWPFRWVTNSGYSAEDLVSDLIGFYRAVNPSVPYVQIFQPVSKDLALQIWDRYGPVGNNKKLFSNPVPISSATSTRRANVWNLASRVERSPTRKARNSFHGSEMSIRIIRLVLLVLAVVFFVVVYTVIVSFSEHQEYSSDSLINYLLTPNELSTISEQCKDKPIFVYSSADGPKPTIVTMSCTIAKRGFENQMNSSGFQYIDGLYQKGGVQIQVITSSDGEEVTSVALIGAN